jgi:putative membrane protein insertion efficiency factor
MKKIFILLIKIYQVCISPFFLKRCNFEPSCSQYVIEAIAIYGIFKGCWLGIKRISKCTPNRQFTYDPVPLKNKKSNN